jgi:hypothetical protein
LISFTAFLGWSCLVVALHGGVQTIALELMNEMFGLFEAVADEDALAGVVDLEHVEFGFLTGPSEDLLEDVGDVIHHVHGVVPANDQVASFVRFAGFFLGPF